MNIMIIALYRVGTCAAYCGVFRRVDAHCTDKSIQSFCPGGAHARSGWTDNRLCDGVPVYQREGDPNGAVLFRILYQQFYPDESTQWFVGPSSNLGYCFSDRGTRPFYYASGSIAGEAAAPDAAGYLWSEGGAGAIHIVAGDGRH